MNENNEKSREPEEDSEKYADFIEVFMRLVDTINNPQIIDIIKNFTEGKLQIERDKLEFQKETQKQANENWYQAVKISYICRMVLSVIFISIVTFLGYNGKLEPAVMATLLTAAAASLFIPPKKG